MYSDRNESNGNNVFAERNELLQASTHTPRTMGILRTVRNSILFLVGICILSGAGQLQAGLITFSDRSIFNAQGNILFNSNFDDFPSGFSFPGDPFARGEVTYTSGGNLVAGSSTRWAPVRNLMTYNQWSPLTGTIESVSSQYDLFGFDIGVLSRQDRITIDVTTNLSNYSFPLLNIANGTQSLEFRGFATTAPGEYFTSFSLTTELGGGSRAIAC